MIRIPLLRCAAARRVGLAVLLAALVTLVLKLNGPQPGNAAERDPGDEAARFLDLSLLVAPDYPCTWPTFPPFQINHYRRIGRLSAYTLQTQVQERMINRVEEQQTRLAESLSAISRGLVDERLRTNGVIIAGGAVALISTTALLLANAPRFW